MADNGGVCNAGVFCILGSLAVSEVVTVKIVVKVDADVRQGTVFTNTVSVFSEELDPPLPLSAVETTQIAEVVDLSVEKQAFPSPAGIGGTVRYQILVRNAGPSDAFDVVITDTLDAGTTFLQASLGFGCTENPIGVVACQIGLLRAGQSQVIEFLVRVRDDVGLSDGDVITNTGGGDQQCCAGRQPAEQ